MEKLKKLFDFFNDETPYYAASLSFFTIFSILPLLALLIVVVSSMPIFEEHLDSMMLYILDFINPTHSLSLTKSIDDFLTNIDKLGNIGIFYLIFVFTMFFKDYEYIINKIYGTQSRGVVKLFFMYLGFLILIPILFLLFIFISTIAKFSFSVHIFTFIFIWIVFIVLFTLSANIKVNFISASISSLLTLIVLSITKSLFGYYVVANTTYTTIYGSFSVALFFFLWIYISWNIYLYGTKLCSIINKGQITNAN
ncbi:MAG: YhjD/YihY/BrkB family envelope integrity protein [Campylobacterota bacterium]|nr:YhjD/YihY/BrkB family envelope integrity protein [Campylobacterota bacterium]